MSALNPISVGLVPAGSRLVRYTLLGQSQEPDLLCVRFKVAGQSRNAACVKCAVFRRVYDIRG